MVITARQTYKGYMLVWKHCFEAVEAMANMEAFISFSLFDNTIKGGICTKYVNSFQFAELEALPAHLLILNKV